LYDAASCPAGQNFPSPVYCTTFSGNTSSDINGLAGNHSYLLYVDGVRNTKANFKITFSGAATGSGNAGGTSDTASFFIFYPNPASTNLFARLQGIPAGNYAYVVYDILGKRLLNQNISLPGGTQTITIPLLQLSSGIYIVSLYNDKGEAILSKKIVKE